MDTTWLAPFAGVMALFHVTPTQIGLAALQVIGVVNTIKALAPTLIETKWGYPTIAALTSMGVAFLTLWPNWVGAVVSGVILFAIQWPTWAAAKRLAVKAKLRGE